MPSGHWGIIVACTQEYKNNDGVWSSLILRGIWPPAKVLEVRKEILLTHTILAKQKIILKPLKNPTKLFKKIPSTLLCILKLGLTIFCIECFLLKN